MRFDVESHITGPKSSNIFRVDQQALAEDIRQFNRFYTEAIGSLDERHEGLSLNLAQSRMLYTVEAMGLPRVSEIAGHLHLDLAYTSRVLGSLESQALVQRTRSTDDGRQRVVSLTADGEAVLTQIKKRSNVRVLGLVEHLDEDQRHELLKAMVTIQSLMSNQE